MITILRIDFKPKDIAEVTFINKNGCFEMVFISMEAIKETFDIEKLKFFIESNI